MAFIYKIYNDINNNLYIGETIRPIEKGGHNIRIKLRILI